MIRIRRKSNFTKHQLNLTFKKKEFKCYLVTWNRLELLDLPVFNNESCDFSFHKEKLSNIWKGRWLSGTIQGLYSKLSLDCCLHCTKQFTVFCIHYIFFSFKTFIFPLFESGNQVLIHKIF